MLENSITTHVLLERLRVRKTETSEDLKLCLDQQDNHLSLCPCITVTRLTLAGGFCTKYKSV